VLARRLLVDVEFLDDRRRDLAHRVMAVAQRPDARRYFIELARGETFTWSDERGLVRGAARLHARMAQRAHVENVVHAADPTPHRRRTRCSLCALRGARGRAPPAPPGCPSPRRG